MARKKEEKNEYYNLLPIGLRKSKSLTVNDKNVLAVLVFLDWEHPEVIKQNDGWFFQSIAKLEKMLTLSPKTILKSLALLEKKGFIERKIGSYKDKIASQYKINHNLVHMYEKKTVENSNDNSNDITKSNTIGNQGVNTINDKEISLINDNDNSNDNTNGNNIEFNSNKDKDKEEDKDKEIAILNLNNNLLFFENPLKEDFQKNNLNNNLFKEHIEDMKEIDFNERLNKAALYCKELENKINSFESKIKTLEIRLKYLEEKYRESKVNDKTDDNIDLNSINVTDLDLSKEENKELYNKYINKLLHK